MFIFKPLKFRSLLILLTRVFLGLPLPLVIGLLSTWSTLLIGASTSLFHTYPNHLRWDSIIFFIIDVTSTLSNAFISSPILSSVSTHPTKYPHLCNVKFIFLLAFHCSTFNLIQHQQSYSCAVKFSFKLECSLNSICMCVVSLSSKQKARYNNQSAKKKEAGQKYIYIK